MKKVFMLLIFFTLYAKSYEENWIDMGNYQYRETLGKVQKIELSDYGDTIFVQAEHEFIVYNSDMQEIFKGFEDDREYYPNQYFLAPDMKSYVIIRDNEWDAYYFDYYFMNNDSLFHKDTALYKRIDNFHETYTWSNFYPVYWYDKQQYEFIFSKGNNSVYGQGSSGQSNKTIIHFTNNNKFRLLYEDYGGSSTNYETNSSESYQNKFKYIYKTEIDTLKYYSYSEHHKIVNDVTVIKEEEESGLDNLCERFVDEEYLLLSKNNTIYKFDLNAFKFIDSIKLDSYITGIGYSGDNIIFSSDNKVYFYNYTQKRITKELYFPFKIYSSKITTSDSLLILGVTDKSYKYNSYLIKARLTDMTPYFTSKFYAIQDTVTIGDTVEFRSNAENPAWNYSWDFGDGKFSNENNPKHFYNSTGYYSVRLIVSDSIRQDTTYKHEYIYVRPEIQALFYTDNEYLHPNESVHFIDTSIGENLNYLWSFGDGEVSSIQSPEHIYKNTGEYDVKLIVWNEKLSDTLEIKKLLKVKPHLKADFTYQRTVEDDKVIIKMLNNSEGDIIENKWITFKGDTLFDVNPEIIYNEPGTYHLKLIVNDGYFTDTLTKYFVAYKPIEDIGIPFTTFKTYQSKFAFDSLYTDNLTNGDNILVFSNDSMKIFNKDDFSVTLTQQHDSSSFPLIVNDKIYNIIKKDSTIIVFTSNVIHQIEMPATDFSIYKVIFVKNDNKIFILTHNDYSMIVCLDLSNDKANIVSIQQKYLIDDYDLFNNKIYITLLHYEQIDEHYKYYTSNSVIVFDMNLIKYSHAAFYAGGANDKKEFDRFKYNAFLDSNRFTSIGHENFYNIDYWDINTWERIDTDEKLKLNNIKDVAKLNNRTSISFGSHEGKPAFEIFNVDSMTSKLKQLNFEGEIIDAVSDGYYVTFYGLYKQNAYQNSFFELKTTFKNLTSVSEETFENPLTDDILISPNPADDYIDILIDGTHLQGKHHIIEIFDVLGNRVLSKSIHPMTQSHRMNVASIPNGLYFVKIGNKFEKFVKM